MNDVHSAVGSYVADALELAERAEFEAHLGYCESCRREVAEFDETTAELAWLVATPAPLVLRDHVLAGIREVRPLPPEDDEVPESSQQGQPTAISAMRPPSMRLSAQDRRFNTASNSPDWDEPVDDLATRRQWRRSRILTVAVAAAMVVALALGGWVYTLVQQREALVAQGEAATRAIARERALLSAPDAKVVTTSQAGARYSFVMSKQRNEALFLGTEPGQPRSGQGLPTVDPGRGREARTRRHGARLRPDPEVVQRARRHRDGTGRHRRAGGRLETTDLADPGLGPRLSPISDDRQRPQSS